MKRNAALGVLVGALLLVLASGVAWAATIQCSPDERRCVGTGGPDTIYGTDEDNDEFEDIRGREGADKIYGRGETTGTTRSAEGCTATTGTTSSAAGMAWMTWPACRLRPPLRRARPRLGNRRAAV